MLFYHQMSKRRMKAEKTRHPEAQTT